MKRIEAYQTSDGVIFNDERKAMEHQQDVIGELLDGLIPYDERGHMTRHDRFNIIMAILKDDKLKDKINKLHDAINHS